MAQIKQSIVFDLDGTLLDVSKKHYAVYKNVIKELNGKPLKREEYWENKRSNEKQELILLKSTIEINKINLYNRKFIERIEDMEYLSLDKLFPGTIQILESLNKYDLFLCTLRRTSTIYKELDELGINKYFKNILLSKSEVLDKSKIIKKYLKITPFAIVGDTEEDFRAARTIGAYSILVTNGLRDGKFIASLKPDLVLSNLYKLSNSLERISKVEKLKKKL